MYRRRHLPPPHAPARPRPAPPVRPCPRGPRSSPPLSTQVRACYGERKAFKARWRKGVWGKRKVLAASKLQRALCVPGDKESSMQTSTTLQAPCTEVTTRDRRGGGVLLFTITTAVLLRCPPDGVGEVDTAEVAQERHEGELQRFVAQRGAARCLRPKVHRLAPQRMCRKRDARR